MNSLLFFDRKFNYKDTVKIDEDFFVADIIASQKIDIKTTTSNNVEEGNFVLSKDNKYILKVIGVNINNNIKTISVSYVDEIFNQEAIVNDLNGNIFNWIKDHIEINISNNEDELSQIPIIVNNKMSTNYTAIINFENTNLKECLKTVFDTTGVFLDYSINYENGNPTMLIVDVKNNNDIDIKQIKYNLPIISNIKRTFTQSQNKNKLILLPEAEGGVTVVFYLLKDGTLTRDSTNINRFENVNQIVKYYKENITAEELVDIATQELCGQEYNHNIEFDILENASWQLNLYDKVNFLDVNETYNTIVSKVTIKGKNVKTITLGVVRKTLTDKLKNTQSKQTVSLTSGGGAVPSLPNWGDIAGVITEQSDLMNEFATKVSVDRKINNKPLTNDVTLSASDIDAIAINQKGVANGVATLGADGKIYDEQIPHIAIGEPFVVGSEVEMLTLVAQTGDVAIRTDIKKNFILKTNIASVLANWKELLVPPDAVSSVAGKTGNVVLYVADISGLNTALATKEPVITKNTAFNKNFETSTSNIKTNGTVSVGSSDNVARADHIHASDNSKLNVSAVKSVSDNNENNVYSTNYVEKNFAKIPASQNLFFVRSSNTNANLNATQPIINSSNYLTSTTTNTTINFDGTPEFTLTYIVEKDISFTPFDFLKIKLAILSNNIDTEELILGFRIKNNGTLKSTNQISTFYLTGTVTPFAVLNNVLYDLVTDLASASETFNSGDIITIEIFKSQQSTTPLTTRVLCGVNFNGVNTFSFVNIVQHVSEVVQTSVNDGFDSQSKSEASSSNNVYKLKNNIENIYNSAGGFSGGNGSHVDGYGGAVGLWSKTGSGGAVGRQAESTDGGAIGVWSKTGYGGAVGVDATSEYGGAVGFLAKTSNGFAGGYNARAEDGMRNPIDAIQLGAGQNPSEKSLKVYNYELMSSNGQIPYDRIKHVFGNVEARIIDAVYPVGAIYTSTVNTSPASFLGGSWSAFAPGRVLVGVGSNGESNYGTAGVTGGSENSVASHTHTQSSHSHVVNSTSLTGTFQYKTANDRTGSTGIVSTQVVHSGSTPKGTSKDNIISATINATHSHTAQSVTPFINSTGGTGGNRMPFITVYMWLRTA